MITIFSVAGIREVQPGDDLVKIVGDAIEQEVLPGDILSVTSKIVSKAENRVVQASSRDKAIEAETVRIVATKRYPGGETKIVQNRNGYVLAAAGVDASNTPYGTVLLLPEDPDESARTLRAGLVKRFGFVLGVIITDTFGRPWREGQTDVAIGAAGLAVFENLAGTDDAHGRPLEMTNVAIADEIASATDLVKGKATQRPVAILRGLERFVLEEDGPGAQAIVRAAAQDMFSLGTAEAYENGYAAGYEAAKLDSEQSHKASDWTAAH